MPRELNKLLKSYEFLQSALDQHGSRMSFKEAASIESRMNSLFLKIVRHQSREPRITLAQARFLVANLLEARKPAHADALRDACDARLRRLEEQVGELTRRAPDHDDAHFRYLDSLSDRVAILDSEYRYVFTNKANADFHNAPREDFIGRPNWQVTSRHFFEAITKPRVDASLAGHRSSLTIPHPNRPECVFNAVFNPLRSPDGTIRGIIAVSHDVTHLGVNPSAITPLP